MPDRPRRGRSLAIALAVAVAAGGVAFARVRPIRPYLEVRGKVHVELPNELLYHVRVRARGGPVTAIRAEVVRGPVTLGVKDTLEVLDTGREALIPVFVAFPAPIGAEIRIVQGGPEERVYRLVVLEAGQ